MGKKGDLLRAAKKQKATYTFTGEELEEHDRQIRRAWSESREMLLQKNAADAINAYAEQVKHDIDDRWDERSRQFKANGSWEEISSAVMSYALSISCRVLIEQFGWKPPNDRGRRTKIMRYAQALTDEIGMISRDRELDIVQYAEETRRLYNLSFSADDAEEES